MDNFSFDSVDQFLEAVKTDQASDKKEAMECISSVLNQENTIAVPLVMGEMIDEFVENYGDVSLKAISLYVLSLWMDVHANVIKDNCSEGAFDNAMLATSDMAKISTAFCIIQQLGIFGEEDDWKYLILKQSADKLVDDCKKKGIKVGDFLNDISEQTNEF